MGIKYKVNEKFFDRWSGEMAYILGFLYADGSMEDASYLRGKYVRASSVDEYSIKLIKNALGAQHPISKIPGRNDNCRPKFFIRIGSKVLYGALFKRGLYPNKSLTINFPKLPIKYTSDFIRGYFDGDGCVFLELRRGKQNKKVVKKLSTIFTSGSKRFLFDLSILLSAIGAQNKVVVRSHRSFQLRYDTEDSIELFKFMYGSRKCDFFLKRKLTKYVKYFKLRPPRVDRQVKKILQDVNYGHVVK